MYMLLIWDLKQFFYESNTDTRAPSSGGSKLCIRAVRLLEIHKGGKKKKIKESKRLRQ